MTMTFQERQKHGAYHEGLARHEFIQRGWETTDLGFEHILPPEFLTVLNQNRADLTGPDFLAKRGRIVWAVDAKTSMGAQQLPGVGKYRISTRSVAAMQAFTRGHRIPSCFVLGDFYVMTWQEVQDRGWNGNGGFYVVMSGDGRPFDQVFGQPGEHVLDEAA